MELEKEKLFFPEDTFPCLFQRKQNEIDLYIVFAEWKILLLKSIFVPF